MQVTGFLYLLAVSLAAYLGGFAPGLVATVLSTLGLSFFYTPPRHDFIPANGDQAATESHDAGTDDDRRQRGGRVLRYG